MNEKDSLEHFSGLAKSLNDLDSATDLIIKVVESPNIYSFSDILEVPIINSMKNLPKYEKYYNLLKLFSYGTYQNYLMNIDSFPKLSSVSIMKLRHLSVVSLASKFRTISYNVLSEQLNVKNIRELEDLIIEAFYADIIKGKLDQLNNQLQIEFAIGRDVTDEQFDEILNILDDWCKNCSVALKTIETEISNANLYMQKQIEVQNTIDTEVLNLKKTIKIQNKEVEMSTSKDANKKLPKMKR